MEWWTSLVSQPKHVVLTVKNVGDLTPGHVTQLQKWFGNLRRRKCCSNWVGGFYSIECTNEGNGWHLHIHALVEARWIDSAELSKNWDSTTGGFGRIVKVKDCRQRTYLSEVTKYVAKGSQLAAWSPAQILAFVQAFSHKRTFGVFGKLYGARTEFAEFIATMKAAKPKCDCGSCSILYFTENEWLAREALASPTSKPIPPPSQPQSELAIALSGVWPD